MFKEQAANRPFSANLRLRPSARMRKPSAALSRMLVAAVLSTPLVLTGAHNEALALSSAQKACSAKFRQCLNSRCVWMIDEQLKNACIRRCETGFDQCWAKAGKGGKAAEGTGAGPLNPKGTGGRTPPAGGTKADPKKPPKTGSHTPPTGGTKSDPKKPPTTGGGGPILLRSSSSSGGASHRSGGGRR